MFIGAVAGCGALHSPPYRGVVPKEEHTPRCGPKYYDSNLCSRRPRLPLVLGLMARVSHTHACICVCQHMHTCTHLRTHTHTHTTEGIFITLWGQITFTFITLCHLIVANIQISCVGGYHLKMGWGIMGFNHWPTGYRVEVIIGGGWG